jgi:hypothetical protein
MGLDFDPRCTQGQHGMFAINYLPRHTRTRPR